MGNAASSAAPPSGKPLAWRVSVERINAYFLRNTLPEPLVRITLSGVLPTIRKVQNLAMGNAASSAAPPSGNPLAWRVSVERIIAYFLRNTLPEPLVRITLSGVLQTIRKRAAAYGHATRVRDRNALAWVVGAK